MPVFVITLRQKHAIERRFDIPSTVQSILDGPVGTCHVRDAPAASVGSVLIT
jgi:hypothetical protein